MTKTQIAETPAAQTTRAHLSGKWSKKNPLLKIWGKKLTGIDPAGWGGFALLGEWLPKESSSVSADLAPGELVVLSASRGTPNYWLVLYRGGSVAALVEAALAAGCPKSDAAPVTAAATYAPRGAYRGVCEYTGRARYGAGLCEHCGDDC